MNTKNTAQLKDPNRKTSVMTEAEEAQRTQRIAGALVDHFCEEGGIDRNDYEFEVFTYPSP